MLQEGHSKQKEQRGKGLEVEAGLASPRAETRALWLQRVGSEGVWIQQGLWVTPGTLFSAEWEPQRLLRREGTLPAPCRRNGQGPSGQEAKQLT